MSVAAFVVSLIAICIAVASLWFTFKADQREETESERSERRESPRRSCGEEARATGHRPERRQRRQRGRRPEQGTDAYVLGE